MAKKYLLKNRKQKLALSLSIINLLFAGGVYAQSTATGVATINVCQTDCLILYAPDNINISSAKFVDPLNESLLFIGTNTQFLDKLTVTDIENNGGFNISVSSDNLINTSNSNEFIPFTEIGLLTYSNNTAGNGLDGGPADSSINTPLYHNYTFADFQNQFSTFDLQMVTNEFTYFTGTGSTSDDIQIINAPDIGGRMAEYSTGIGLVIKIPDIINNFINDGNYNLNLTFTLNRT